MPEFFREGTLRPGAGESVTCLLGFGATRVVRKVIIYGECPQTQVRIPGDPVRNAGAARPCGGALEPRLPTSFPRNSNWSVGSGQHAQSW